MALSQPRPPVVLWRRDLADIRAPEELGVAAGRQLLRLIDPPFTRDAAAKGEIAAYPFCVLPTPGCDLIEMPNAERVQAPFVLRPDAANALEVVGRSAAWRRKSIGATAVMSAFTFKGCGLPRQAVAELSRLRINEWRVGGCVDLNRPGLHTGGMLGFTAGGEEPWKRWTTPYALLSRSTVQRPFERRLAARRIVTKPAQGSGNVRYVGQN